MPLSKTGCLFIHVPKCAGTSFEVALEIADGYPNIGLQATKTKSDEERLFGGGLQHLSIREINTLYPEARSRATFSFGIIREPVERFASYLAWQYHRFRDEPPPTRKIEESIAKGMEDLNEAAANLGFFNNPKTGILQITDRQNASAINGHMRHLYPQCGYIFDNGEIAIEKIYRFDRIRDAELELRKLGHLTRPLPTRMQNDYTPLFLGALGPEHKGRIKEIYHHDSNLFEST